MIIFMLFNLEEFYNHAWIIKRFVINNTDAIKIVKILIFKLTYMSFFDIQYLFT